MGGMFDHGKCPEMSKMVPTCSQIEFGSTGKTANQISTISFDLHLNITFDWPRSSRSFSRSLLPITSKLGPTNVNKLTTHEKQNEPLPTRKSPKSSVWFSQFRRRFVHQNQQCCFKTRTSRGERSWTWKRCAAEVIEICQLNSSSTPISN